MLLLSVILTAIFWGVGPGLLAALVSSLSLRLFFFVSSSEFLFEQLVAFATFLLASILVGRLSARARRSTREAENLRATFDHASELEAAKRNEQFKSVLLDAVTHDFRSPLTSIKAAATALLEQDTSLSPTTPRISHGLLQTIVQESDRMNQFIQGMIEMANAGSAICPPGLAAHDVPLEDVLAVALSRAEDLLRNHKVTVTCEDDLSIRAHPRAISQVLFSLLENAAKYSSPYTTISISAVRQDIDFVDVAVEDEGPGIPHQLREAVFDKFVRVRGPGARTAGDLGLGMGLAIAQGIVSGNGGTIRVEDRLDGRRGARFVFSLPASPQPKAVEAKGASVG